MNLNSPHARDVAYVVHQQTNLSRYVQTGGPLMTRGDGIYVTDDAGNRKSVAAADGVPESIFILIAADTDTAI